MTKDRLTKEDLKDILSLFRSGKYKAIEIARKYGKDHSTIHHHLKKAGLLLKVKKNRTVKPQIDESLNSGSSYAEYVEKETMRRLEMREKCQHAVCEKVVRCKCCGKTKISLGSLKDRP